MADDPEVGSAEVSIVPSLKGFKEQVAEGTADLPDAKVPVKPDTTGFGEELDAKVDPELHPRSVKVDIDVDTAEALVKLAALDAEIDASNSATKGAGNSASEFSGGIGLLGSAIALSLPLLPELTAGIVAVGGALAAAGAGLVSFGAVALTDITSATAATQKLQAAQTAVDNATTQQARADALTKQKALVDSLGPSTIALGGAVTALGTAWKGFAAGFTPELTRDITAVSGLLTDALPMIQPLVTAGAGAVSTILSDLDTALKSPEAQQFFAWIAGTAEHDILGLTTAFGGFASGVLLLFEDFAPVETLVVNGLAGMGTAFESWAAHLTQTQGFQQFLAYAIANGPLLTHTLADVGTAFGHILESITPLLPPLLNIIDFTAQLVTSLPPLSILIGATLVGSFFALNAAVKLLTDASLPDLVKLLFGVSGAEDAVAGSSAAAAAGLDGVGAAIGRIGGPLGSLLKLFGVTTLADALGISVGAAAIPVAVGAAALAGVGYAISEGGPTGVQAAYLDYVHGKINRAQYDAAVAQAGGTPVLGNQFVGDNALAQDPSLAGSDAALAAQGHGLSLPNVVGDQTAANLQSTYDSQVPGGFTSYTQAYAGAGKGTGSASYTLPLTPGAGASAAANNAQGLAGLLGLNLMQSLAQGITTGTNPLTQAFQNINLKLTGPAQTLGTQLQTIFTNALQLGQQAAQSLAFSVTAAPTVGSYTSIYRDAQGHTSTTVQSPLVGSALNTLLTDQKFVTDLQKAAQLGLAPTLRAQFVNAGPSSLATLDAIVNSGPSAVAQLDQTNASITALGNSFGLQVAGDQYGPQVVATLEQILATLKGAPAAHGAATAAALDKTAGKAITKAATTGPRGPFGAPQ